MKCIVGLGNPGSRYSHTRHNAGRLLAERIAEKQPAIRFQKKKQFKSSIASIEWHGHEVILACPETYVNLSGEAVKALTDYLPLAPGKDLLILVDDSALDFGALRLRLSGSSGGHNGLKSIEESLGTQTYPRLRLGIGSPAGEPLEEYVLAQFNREETLGLPSFLERGEEACRLWITEPPDKAVNAVNSMLASG